MYGQNSCFHTQRLKTLRFDWGGNDTTNDNGFLVVGRDIMKIDKKRR